MMRYTSIRKILFLCLGVCLLQILELRALSQNEKPFFEQGYLETGLAEPLFIPSVARSDAGTLFCTFSGDLKTIWVTWSADAGKTWAKPVKAMERPGKGYTESTKDRPDGDLVDSNILVIGKRVKVFATYVPAPSPPYGRSDTWVATSEDSGRTWSRPSILPPLRKYSSGKIHTPFWLDDKTVAMGVDWDVPAEQGRAASSEPEMHANAGLLVSTDGGETWTLRGAVDVDIKACGAGEPGVVKLKNGDLFMVVRTYDAYPYETRSHDGGLTWDKPKASQFLAHNSPTDLLRLKDGGILRLWDNHYRERFPLVASISKDECQTWSQPVTITTPQIDAIGKRSFGQASYASAVQADDGTIVVVWWETTEWNTPHAKSKIGLARFNRAWVEK